MTGVAQFKFEPWLRCWVRSCRYSTHERVVHNEAHKKTEALWVPFYHAIVENTRHESQGTESEIVGEKFEVVGTQKLQVWVPVLLARSAGY